MTARMHGIVCLLLSMALVPPGVAAATHPWVPSVAKEILSQDCPEGAAASAGEGSCAWNALQTHALRAVRDLGASKASQARAGQQAEAYTSPPPMAPVQSCNVTDGTARSTLGCKAIDNNTWIGIVDKECDNSGGGGCQNIKDVIPGCQPVGNNGMYDCGDAFSMEVFNVSVPHILKGLYPEKKKTRTVWVSTPKAVGDDTPFLFMVQPAGGRGFWSTMGADFILVEVAKRFPVVVVEPSYEDAYYPTADTQEDSRWNYMCRGRNYSEQYDTACWSRYIEQPFLQELFDTLVEKGFNTDRCCVMGLSAGAQMASRVAQSFPDMKAPRTKKPFPDVIGLVLGDGGSYQCYAYHPDDGVPQAFNPCPEPSLQCCPSNFTEQRWSESQISHPPTLVVQPHNDSFADPLASAKYFDAVSAGGGMVLELIGEKPGYYHAIPPVDRPYVLEFILQVLALQMPPAGA